MGDGIQAAKAGILEIGDIFVVNKSDREGAQALIRELRTMIALAHRRPQDWKPPIVSTVAYEHRGIDDLLEAVDQFRAAQTTTGRALRRRVARARREVETIALAKLRSEFQLNGAAGLDDLAEAVSRGEFRPRRSSGVRRADRRRACCLSDSGSGKKKSIQASACTPVHAPDCLNSLEGDRKDE
jgi:LAO/AO transport system kinase